MLLTVCQCINHFSFSARTDFQHNYFYTLVSCQKPSATDSAICHLCIIMCCMLPSFAFRVVIISSSYTQETDGIVGLLSENKKDGKWLSVQQFIGCSRTCYTTCIRTWCNWMTDVYYLVINYNYVFIYNKQCKKKAGLSLFVLLSTQCKQYT
jgi:hypothetical protein